ncbi:MAG TPA: cell division protein SepF [Desulfosporosinus sp.]|nr:cell division protein SepF [Desulfosporosinus sp.]
MSNMLNTALDFMGFLTTEEDDDGFNIETMPRKNKEKIVSLHTKTSQPTIVHITPKAFDDVMDIVKRLQDKTIVTINLALVDVALRDRIIDFANGSVYALDGGFMKLADNVYLFAGKGVTLQERQRDYSKFPWSKTTHNAEFV